MDKGGESHDVGPEAAQHPNQWGRCPLALLALDASCIRLFVALDAEQGADGLSRVSRAELIRLTGMNRRTVQRAMRTLEATGWLITESVGTGHDTSVHRVVLGA